MTFEQWLNENEGFSLRMERAYDELVKDPIDTVDNWPTIKQWLKAAYDVGKTDCVNEHKNLLDSLKNEIKTQRKEIAGLREERRMFLDNDLPPEYTKD